MNPVLSSTVSIVKISDSVLEFFKTNTRQQVRIRVPDDTIKDIASSLDGTLTIEQIAEKHSVTKDDLMNLLSFLERKGLLETSLPHDDFDSYSKYRRVIHFLQDYASSHEQLVEYWRRIRNSRVLIIGLGAVGSWVAVNLVQSGVKNLVLMDPDVVDASNLHRQLGYTEADIGKLKVDVMEDRLRDLDSVNIIKSSSYLDEKSLNLFNNESIDLIINCADKPTVDATSLWVGEYAMRRGITHIVGGGYNLHLSLIGQTIIPGETACACCFQKQLEEQNTIDSRRVKKLSVKNRKIGSFGPMSSMIAAIVGMDAVKVLSGCTVPANINRRGEFNIYTMDIQYQQFERRNDCEWCGIQGKYYHKECIDA